MQVDAESNERLVTPRPRAIYWVASLALAGVLLYYSLRGIEWGRVWSIVRGAQPREVALALAVSSLTLFLRAVRWRVLLLAKGDVSIPLAFWATAAGYLGNNVLPARAGEVVRTVMISGRSGMSRAFVLTTALSERVVDALTLVTISGTVLLTLQEKPGWLADAAKPFAILGLFGVACIAIVPAFESLWFRLLSRLPVPDGLRYKVEHVLCQALQGIRSFHDIGRLFRFLALTAVIWLLDGLTTVLAAHAIGLSIQLPLAFLLVAGLGLGSALPSTPGYVGIYQFVAVSILTPFGFSRTDAIAYILFYQAMGYLVVMTWGLIALGQQRGAILSRAAAVAPPK
jgi:uncharacterized protein (TIRG00374 family)